jgi:2-oxoglutarate/2-oxoacid ferredoxin oxidoreductase subunit beta
MTIDQPREIVPTDLPPTRPARLIRDFTPDLIDVGAHNLCPGCGEPIAMRSMLEAVTELGAIDRAIAVFGIGCYTAFSNNLDCEVLQALHGRAPSLATGAKRMLPDALVFTVQGDGDMASEGLQEVIHSAARGENITCFMLNNGVFGETGGHMTVTTALGQRTKNTLEGRNAAQHGYPIPLGSLLTPLEGVAYVARGAVNNGPNVNRTRKMINRALQIQLEGGGFTFVEILTMCPTGWFIDTTDAPTYLTERVGDERTMGVAKDTHPAPAA